MKKFFKSIDNFIFGKLQNHYARKLEESVKDCKTLLDVGCGSDSPVKFFKNRPHMTGIDAFEPSIEKSRAAKIHDDYKKMNVMDLYPTFPENSFEAVIASDLIEHLKKEDGFKLIDMMEKVASKKVVIFTPNGFLEQRAYDGNELQVHLSGWEIDEMRARGYTVTGINGWKKLRGEFAQVRYRPRVFWGRISLMSQWFTTRRPKNAFAILCVKDMEKANQQTK